MGGGASTDRIEALHNQIFSELDINSDGVLDRKELGTFTALLRHFQWSLPSVSDENQVNVPGLGSFQLDAVTAPPDPCPAYPH